MRGQAKHDLLNIEWKAFDQTVLDSFRADKVSGPRGMTRDGMQSNMIEATTGAAACLGRSYALLTSHYVKGEMNENPKTGRIIVTCGVTNRNLSPEWVSLCSFLVWIGF